MSKRIVILGAEAAEDPVRRAIHQARKRTN
jgi:hypothetical protein